MKKNLLFAAAMLSGLFATAQEGYTTVNVSLQPQYADQVYYKFSTNTQTPIVAASWDLAFEKAPGMMGIGGIRVNDGKGIKVFQAADTEAGYATVDVTQEASWTELYNDSTDWSTGAFDNADNNSQFGYGWGNYNTNSHHVDGVIVFVLKFSDGSYKKLFIEDYNPYNGQTTFKYAAWNGTAWSADENKVVDAAAEGYHFNYFSMQTNNVVTVAPADAAWDIVFRKYNTDLNAGTDDEPVMYNVTGALHSTLVTVAQTDETGNTDTTPTLPAPTAYSDDINTIGDDWKAFTGSGYAIDDTNTYYVKHQDGNIYRMYFTSFEGSSTGNLSFNYKNVGTTAGLEDLNNDISFGFYPNPSADKNITLIYDLKNASSDKNTVSIYSLTGAKVFETEITNNSGFYTKVVNLSALTSGMYIVTMESGKYTVSKKLVIR